MLASSSCLHNPEPKKEKKKLCLFNRICRKQKDLNVENSNCTIVIKNNNCLQSSDSLLKVNNGGIKADDNCLQNTNVSTSVDLQPKSILCETNDGEIKISISANPDIDEGNIDKNKAGKQLLEKPLNKDSYIVCYLKFNKSANNINHIGKKNTYDKIDKIVNKENKCYSKDDSDVKSVKFTKILPEKSITYNSFNNIRTKKSLKTLNESFNGNIAEKFVSGTSHEKSIENISKKNISKRQNQPCTNGREIRVSTFYEFIFNFN